MDISEAELEAAQVSLGEVAGPYMHRLGALRKAVEEGRIHGGTVGGIGNLIGVAPGCGCVIGHADGRRSWEQRREASWTLRDRLIRRSPFPCLPTEHFVIDIRPGDTPATNPRCAILLGWIDELIASNP